MRATEALDLLKIIEVIGRNVDSPILLKGDMNGVQEVWCYDSAPVVTPFWPWIGKQEIKCFDRSSVRSRESFCTACAAPARKGTNHRRNQDPRATVLCARMSFPGRADSS